MLRELLAGLKSTIPDDDVDALIGVFADACSVPQDRGQ